MIRMCSRSATSSAMCQVSPSGRVRGGGGYGDSIAIRGYSASSDITVDGVRDSAQYTRSDSFNLEQVEVTKGANSVYSGVGAIGGTINLVTKTPKANAERVITAGVGTDGYYRLTADLNQPFAETAAARLNLMTHVNDVPGRDVERYERWGLAPSLALGIGTATRLTLTGFYQEDENIPEYGVLFRNNRPVPGVDPSDYFGYRNVDIQKSKTASSTAIIDHRVSSLLRIRNLSRWAQTEQLTIVDPPQGNVCIEAGQPPLGATSGTCTTSGTYQPSGPRGNVRDTENAILTNQTDLTWTFATGDVRHTLVTGFQLSHERYGIDGSREFNNPDGSPVTSFPVMDLYNPDSFYTGPRNRLRTSKADGSVENVAVYAFDALELSERWELNGGLRYERNVGSTTPYTIKTYTAPTSANPDPDNSNLGAIIGGGVPATNSEDLLSYRAGLIFKPVPNGSVYIAYGNSETPSKASVNASCRAVPTSSSGANCSVDPEQARNYELGSKWEFADGALSVNAALFRNERNRFRVNDPESPTGEQVLDGKNRVDGVEIGAYGQITPQWSVFASFVHLDSEILQSVADGVESDPQKGKPLPNTPDNALSLWTVYELPIRLRVGYGVQYQGEVLPNGSAPAPNDVKVPGYWVHRAMVGYAAVPKLDFQLNVNNIFDEEYYTRIRGNGWATPGEGFNTVLSAFYRF